MKKKKSGSAKNWLLFQKLTLFSLLFFGTLIGKRASKTSTKNYSSKGHPQVSSHSLLYELFNRILYCETRLPSLIASKGGLYWLSWYFLGYFGKERGMLMLIWMQREGREEVTFNTIFQPAADGKLALNVQMFWFFAHLFQQNEIYMKKMTIFQSSYPCCADTFMLDGEKMISHFMRDSMLKKLSYFLGKKVNHFSN